MNTTSLPLHQAALQVRFASILLASGVTLSIFGLFGIARGFVFTAAPEYEAPGIRPGAARPSLEAVPDTTATPIPQGTTWEVPTATPGGIVAPPPDTAYHGVNHDIPGCGTQDDGIIRCWGGASLAPGTLLPGEIYEDANGTRYGQSIGTAANNQQPTTNSQQPGFRTGSGLRKDK